MRTLSIAALVALVVGCGGQAETPAPAPAPEPAPAPAPAPEPEPAADAMPDGIVSDDGTVATVSLEANDKMMFNTKRIEVPAGRKVKLTLTHVGEMDKVAMGHNFVLLQPGTDPTEFATKSMTAKDAGYIGDEVKDKVIAHTEVLGGGESDTIEFDAPAPGEYPFLCSFPGHVGLMKGVFVVE